ncbi:MAG: conjugal transfer protein TraF [Vicinamibacterales bacterium]
MLPRNRRYVAAAWLCAFLFAGPQALAQPVERVGVRALGMAGAFVAVADDASAAYWNPASLNGGNFFGFTLDYVRQPVPRGDSLAVPQGPLASETWLGAVVTPPLGLSFYRLEAWGRDRRADRGGIGIPVARLSTSHIGVTVLQSLTDRITVGTTVKLVRGRAGSGQISTATSGDALRDAAAALGTSASSAVDLDVGVRADAGFLRFGLLARNVLRPSFDTPEGDTLGLDRQIRLGVAVVPSESWTVSADADLLRTESFEGRNRGVAIGLERWLADRRFALRGGVRFRTLDDAEPIAALGAGVALRTGLFLDVHANAASDDREGGFGLSARLVF